MNLGEGEPLATNFYLECSGYLTVLYLCGESEIYLYDDRLLFSSSV